MIFRYFYVGHILANEKVNLDADELLAQIRKNTEEINKERIKKGWSECTILGWDVKPHYNASTNNLELAIRLKMANNTVDNYRVALLGREGVLNVNAVLFPENLQEELTGVRAVLANIDFNPGQKYTEYRDGDKLAAYGLAALIVGGATAVAIKSGFGAWLGKALLAAGVLAFAFILKLFKRKK